MKKIIIDTNFLMIPFQFKIDIFSEIEKIVLEPYSLYIVDKTIDELNKIINEQKGKDKTYAKMATTFIKLNKIKIINSNDENTKDNYVDDIIVKIVDKDYIVCTQDKELKKRVKEKKAKIIEMKQRNHLVINN